VPTISYRLGSVTRCRRQSGKHSALGHAPVHVLIVSGSFMTRRYQNALTILRRCFPRMLPCRLASDGWLPLPIKSER
jgi:hypothetical protein